MSTRAQATERQAAIDNLRAEGIVPGDTIYTALEHVSRSGMRRSIKLYTIRDGEPQYIAGYAARALGMKRNPDGDGIITDGCGMDMGFELVYNLGRAMWPAGFLCAGEPCVSNDHFNGDRDRTPGHCTHRDGGYALRHRWL